MALTLEVLPLRLSFRCPEPVVFPSGQPGNIVRGAFGSIFRRLVCAESACRPSACARRAACPYLEVFDPPKPLDWPSGFATPPRGFVFRAHHLDGRTVPAGGTFHFDLHLFHRGASALPHFLAAFTQLGREGLGPGRGRAEMERAELLDALGSPSSALLQTDPGTSAPPLSLALDATGPSVARLVVRFVTPTELKSGGEVANSPEFATLVARARDRVSALRALYGPGPLPLDFGEMARRAASVRLVRCELDHVRAERRSSRTGLRHPLGGFTGVAEYAGEVAEFLPLLRAAWWTGVGRQTVWGKGVIETEVLPPHLS
jgi:hypothetical protein